jgi:hypothetical protein
MAMADTWAELGTRDAKGEQLEVYPECHTWGIHILMRHRQMEVS